MEIFTIKPVFCCFFPFLFYSNYHLPFLRPQSMLSFFEIVPFFPPALLCLSIFKSLPARFVPAVLRLEQAGIFLSLEVCSSCTVHGSWLGFLADIPFFPDRQSFLALPRAV
jgi:hypothetical protein